VIVARPEFAEVVFNHPLRDRFTYRIPDSWKTVPPLGARVQATFARRPRQLGFVVGTTNSPGFDPKKILPLENLLDEAPLFPEPMLPLLEWLAEYYQCSLGEALFAAFPFGSRTDVRRAKLIERGPEYDRLVSSEKLTPQRKKVLKCFTSPAAQYPLRQLAEVAGVSEGVVQGLVKLGALDSVEVSFTHPVSEAEELYRSDPVELNEAQKDSVVRLSENLRAGKYRQFLLHGVTGSGKTEVFLAAIAEALAQGKTALVLVPEISLTPQTAARYRGRFPGLVEVLHSGLSQARRYDAWNRVREGESPVVVGTRSAVFAPLPNLGLVVVDEEHDPSYKQSDPAPRYHARDVAIYRGLLSGAVVLLGSATPSLESYENVSRKKAVLLELPARATAHQLPEVRLIDMRQRSPSERILSAEARAALSETLGMGLQSILFLNRRGHSTQLSCRECGYVLQCENCSVSLVWHGSDQSLRCHYCSYRQSEPELCPACGSVWIRARGYGTEQVAEGVTSIFPAARVERIDLDTTREEGSHDRILSRLRKGEIDILVGTQMVSKGLDMPGVRLVVVVQAETSLNIADFRAPERSFALLTQVAGRAGRGEHAGLVLVQSYQPHHYSIRLALNHDYLGFRKQERRLRHQLALPPHTRLVNFRVEGEEESKVRKTIQDLAALIEPEVNKRKKSGCRLIGPTPCPLERLQNRYRWQFLIATLDAAQRAEILAHPPLQELLRKPPAKIKVVVDVDPLALL
jgi:primosomal protein N' (replication factor Y)